MNPFSSPFAAVSHHPFKIQSDLLGGGVSWSPASLGANLLQNFDGLAYSGSLIGGLPVIPSTVGTLAQPRGQRCALFDGVDDFCSVPVTLNGATEFSIWRRAKYLASTSYDLDGIGGTLRFGRDNGSNQVWWDPGVAVGGTAISVPNNVWHTLAMTTKSGGTARLYKDGTQVSTASPGAFTVSNALQFWIGANNTDGTTFNHGSNYIVSDYRIYNRELTASEITWLDTDGASGTDPGLTNCLFRCTFSEESGTTAYDSSGKGNHGTYTNITQATFHATDSGVRYSLPNEKGYTLSGAVVKPVNEASLTLDASGSALQFAGPIGLPAAMEVPCITTISGEQISLSDIRGSFGTTGTIALLLKANAPTNAIATNSLGSSGATSWYPFTNFATGDVYLDIMRTTRLGPFTVSNTNQWHWMIVTTEPGANGWKLYRNNTLITSQTGEASVSFSATQLIDTQANIASVLMWNVALTQGQIDSLVASETIPTSGLVLNLPCQDGSGTSNTNRTVANVSSVPITASLVNGTVSVLWGTRTAVRRDWCIQAGGGIAANGAFVAGIPGSGNDAAGNAKTLAVGEHRNPFSRFVPNNWSAPSLVNIGSDATDKYAPTDAVQAESVADTRFRKVGYPKYLAVKTALVGSDKTNAQNWVA
jgi:hypothetical protein